MGNATPENGSTPATDSCSPMQELKAPASFDFKNLEFDLSPVFHRAFARAVSIASTGTGTESLNPSDFLAQPLDVLAEVRGVAGGKDRSLLAAKISFDGNSLITFDHRGQRLLTFQAENISYLKLVSDDTGYIHLPQVLPDGQRMLAPSAHLPESRHYPHSGLHTMFGYLDDRIKPDLFRNDEILRVHPVIKTVQSVAQHSDSQITPRVDLVELPARSDGNAKINRIFVIAQAEHKSCTGTAVSMLLADRGSRSVIDYRNLDVDGYISEITRRGFEPIAHCLAPSAIRPHDPNIPFIAVEDESQKLLELKRLTDLYGAAIVTVQGLKSEIGNHALIIDRVADDLSAVTLRDPWHGWCIDVTAEAFSRRAGLRQASVVQIKDPEQARAAN